uniref:Uncharacterized protein n=1 Tax=Plectosphaerella sp. TaxID=1929893 RepID=A0A4D6SWD8_9PEZI|nr:hypothetical protein [Plectosphaerella sp.]
MCITIFLFLLPLYNFILEYKYFKDTFLNTNKFKLVLIILIVISFFAVSFELYWFLDLFFSKFVILIKSFFKEILNGKGSGNNSPQGGSPPPSGNSLYAATGSNRSSSESPERYPEERPFLDLPQEITKPLRYPENEIGLKGYGRKPYADTGIAVPANCVPVSNNSITLPHLSPSTSWHTHEPTDLKEEKYQKILNSKNVKELNKEISATQSQLITGYRPLLERQGERYSRANQERANISNLIGHLKENLTSNNIQDIKTMSIQFLSFPFDRLEKYKSMSDYKDINHNSQK